MTAIVVSSAAARAEQQHCVRAEVVLWGDGKHDDTEALAAWLRGADAVWATSGAPVGAAIAGHSFRLSEAVYVEAGTGRRLDDFRLLWPERGESVLGGTIAAGSDPNAAPVLAGVHIEGGDPGEGVPFEIPDRTPADRASQANCATS
jgi:hypothetical protein